VYNARHMRTGDSVLLIGLILAVTVQAATGQTSSAPAAADESDRPCRRIPPPLV